MAKAPRDPGLYTRWVGLLKITLPLVAIGILSTVFLVQQEDQFEGGLVFTKIDRATLGDGLTISNPRYSGITTGGDAFTLAAVRATPDQSKATKLELTDIKAEFSYANGLNVLANAAHGLALISDQVLHLDGGLTGESTNGFMFNGTGGVFDLRSGAFESAGAVTIVGPDQRLEAGKMRVTPAQNDENQILFFEKGVKITYIPASSTK